MNKMLKALPLTLLMLTTSNTWAASPSCIDTAKKNWLADNDSQYHDAHTRTCHVSISINGLIGRIEARGGHLGPHCSPTEAASTFPDIATAQRVVTAILNANAPEIDTWFNTAADGAAWPTSAYLDQNVGTVVSEFLGKKGKNRHACHNRDDYTCLKSMQARVVIRRINENSCILLTAFPT